MGLKLESPLRVEANEVQIVEVRLILPAGVDNVMIGLVLEYGYYDVDGKWVGVRRQNVGFSLRNLMTGAVDEDVKVVVDAHYDSIKQSLYDLLKKKGVVK